MARVDSFFAYARERHATYLRRAAGGPRPWTEDKILQEFRFTNVFRELDKTTAWFRQCVRDPLRSKPDVLLATVLFRLLNRIEVGEAVFSQLAMEQMGPAPHNVRTLTAFDRYLQDGDVRHVRRAIKQFVGKDGPYVTGAYIISSPPGHSKLDGVLRLVDAFRRRTCERENCGRSDWACLAQTLLDNRGKHTLQQVWSWLSTFEYFGHFHSYEIVTDLRHTALLDRAPDILTWANVGPGAQRGLNRIFRGLRGKEANRRIPTEQALDEMRQLLEASRLAEYWPQFMNVGKHDQHLVTRNNNIYMHDKTMGHEQWPQWEMRDVEHTLCEFDKYTRVKLGEGRPRGVFR